jgi:NTP pyrophosphatase (non-canonical NTP hydrolase)
MEFDRYQKEALRTDRVPVREDSKDVLSLIVPMLGLAGETGQLLSEYKKHLRDGEAHRLFEERVSEELGDLLWYIANVASKFDLTLEEIATANLAKVKARWATERTEPLCFDATLPEGERLPRRFEVELFDVEGDDRQRVRVFINGVPFGAEMTDNAYDPDGYRFHDIFHFAYAAVLGWSPVTRALLQCKRKSRPLLDEVEDGGRAAVIEEGVAALAFDYARRHHMLAGVSALDFQLLRMIKDMTSHLEVGQCTTGDWEQAILQGFNAWRTVLAGRGGRIMVDLDRRRIEYTDRSHLNAGGEGREFMGLRPMQERSRSLFHQHG